MPYMTSEQIAECEADLATVELQLTAANSALTSGSLVSEYRLDTGEGSQRVVYRSLSELNSSIRILTAKRNNLRQKLDGSGISYMTLRRR